MIILQVMVVFWVVIPIIAKGLALLLCIQKVLGSYLDLETDCPDRPFHGFPHSIQADARIVPFMRLQPHSSPYLFQFIIHKSSYYSTLYSLSH